MITIRLICYNGLVFAYNIPITVSYAITRISLTRIRYNAIDEKMNAV
jgi:hypothetical protein